MRSDWPRNGELIVRKNYMRIRLQLVKCLVGTVLSDGPSAVVGIILTYQVVDVVDVMDDVNGPGLYGPRL
jgi:hypothetical protein